ncbi:glycerol-3-phosphate dehydrogenase/oxidase [Phaeodactylibacter xiamenensis]|uniref:glycerol-3-phosphate dehydrogenase/oxidase n=1 Tax=Phaeodactylibacter xiamenensis TaxID=1524460 RepID=UPI003CCC2375
MKRNENIAKIKNQSEPWDLAVIGGGASGLGIALDALSRGLSVVLLEKVDFAKGTSSRSTKLLHGGVRYLAQGDVFLVLEALKERGLMMKNAPHLSGKQAFIIPIYTRWDQLKYGVGLKVYDLMAGRLRIGRSHIISRKKVVEKIPTIKQEGLLGGVVYYDGQFDDARLAVAVAQTCSDMGGCVVNYTEVTGLSKAADGKINGVEAKDLVEGEAFSIPAKSVVNATGVFSDTILKMDQPGVRKSILPSQGAHLALDLSFLGGKDALMIPETPDGRVLFGIPWFGTLILGTTDTPRSEAEAEPKALEEEIDFILETAADYLVKPPTRADVLSVFAGLRPLAAPKTEGAATKEVSRSHKIVVSDSDLFSILGGKWTTFRQMGEDMVDEILKVKKMSAKGSTSAQIRLHGYPNGHPPEGHWRVYGSEAKAIQALIAEQPELQQPLHPKYPNTKAEVVWMARHEMAQRIEDVLARRLRTLFMDAQAALDMAAPVGKILQEELGRDDAWYEKEVADFQAVARGYLLA